MNRSPLPARTAPLKRTPIKRSTLKLGGNFVKIDCADGTVHAMTPRTPVRKKRKAPRRGRVIDRNRMAWAAQKPCQITGEFPATTHHVREFGSPKDDTKIIRLVDYLHMKSHARPGIPCVEDGKELFEKFHSVTIGGLVENLEYDYEVEESGTGVGWGT